MFRKHAMEDGRTGSTGPNYDYWTLVFHRQPLTLYSRDIPQAYAMDHIINQKML